MEVTKMSSTTSSEKNNKQDDQEVMLPGFRFHPTDEELVGFYLRRKVEKKPIRIEIIKQADIYKYDPWDLPRVSTVEDKEWYFFCMRGRKYRNSIRPNRVTGSGFWKATGIDKPIHSVKEPHECIGLKKSLVYYRGSAGKGTKTDWMMHEFRLPPNGKSTNLSNVKDIAQEAEVWTLCRIFKRTPSYKKYTANWKDGHSTTTVAANAIKLHNPTDSISSKTCSSSLESETSCDQQQQQQQQQFYYMHQVQNETKPFIITNDNIGERNHLFMTQLSSQSPYSASYNPSFWNPNSDDFLANGNWDELGSVVELAIDPSHVYDCR